MMKKIWVAFASIGLLVLPQMALSTDEELLRLECYDQAVQGYVPEADVETYIADCMQNAVERDGELQDSDDASEAEMEEGSGKDKS